jgi:hypothetical protein
MVTNVIVAAHDQFGGIIMLRHPTNGRATAHGRKSRTNHATRLRKFIGTSPSITRQQRVAIAIKLRKKRDASD